MDIPTIRVMSVCSGGGGLDLGLRLAVPSARTVCYVENEATAIEVLVARMEEGFLDKAPVWTDLRTFDGKPWSGAVDVLLGGYPCFVPETLVLTDSGYKRIDSLAVGELVLTHRGRWRKVTGIMSREGALLRKMEAQGVEGVVTTDEHPFLSRGRGHKLSRKNGKFGWVKAEELRPSNEYLAQVLPSKKRGDRRSPDFWWVVGRYLADGWRQLSPSHRGKGRVNICCNRVEADELEARIRCAGFKPYRSEERTTTRFAITRKWFYSFLSQFGDGASGKRIPRVALELSTKKAASLLDGYITGDGYVGRDGEKRGTTISRALALGVALLAQRAFGVVASIRKCRVPPRKRIEGRLVKQHPFYVVSIPKRNRSAFVVDGYGWKLLRTNRRAGRGRVFNISVEEDESYVAEGAVVHNCQPWSIAGLQRGKDDPRHLWPCIAERIREIQPGLCFFENVSNHLTLGFDEVRAELQGMGYGVEAGLFAAAETGAPHLRRRLFILASIEHVADAVGGGVGGGDQRGPQAEGQEARQREDGPEVADELGDGGKTLDNPHGPRHGSGEPGPSGKVRDEARGKEPERRGRPVAGDEHVGDPPGKGLEVGVLVGEDKGQELEAIVRAGRGVWGIEGEPRGHIISARGVVVPVYPPGPSSREWADVIHKDPSLEPAVRHVADELADGVGRPTRSRRADQIRLLGNGVVPSCAALAFLTLLKQSEEG